MSLPLEVGALPSAYRCWGMDLDGLIVVDCTNQAERRTEVAYVG